MLNPLPLAVAAVIAVVVWLAMRRGRIDPARAQQLIAQGARVIDVRMPAEYRRGHIPDADNWPLPDLRKHAKLATPLTVPIIVYCQSGARSALAARLLRASGANAVYDLGAIERWPGGLRSVDNSSTTED